MDDIMNATKLAEIENSVNIHYFQIRHRRTVLLLRPNEVV